MLRRNPALIISAGLLAAVAAAPAADLPLGVVEKADAAKVTFRFLAEHTVTPDDMVAIYGSGKIEKHPLTKEVIKEDRALVAKAQVLAVAGDRLEARLTWTAAGKAPAAGDDVIPLPGEASPDAPPVLTGEVAVVSAEAQGTVEISLPVTDPEGGPLLVAWSLAGTHPGVVESRTTGVPAVRWTAPAVAGDIQGLATVRDRRGQALEVPLVLKAGDLAENWRTRRLEARCRFGKDADRAMTWLSRGPDGRFWGIDQRGTVLRITPGWNRIEPQPLAAGVPTNGALAVELRGDEIFVLDGRERAVLVLAQDGVLRRKLDGLRTPTDLALAADGTTYIADQQGGGLMVYEADGRFRCQLGRAGETADAFQGLAKVAVGDDGTCYALDAKTQQVHRFDRFHHRLDSWAVQAGAENPPVDLAVHPRGLHVLTASGKVLVFNREGTANESLPPLSEAKLFESLRAPTGLAVDASGDVLVAYPEEGLVARYDGTGKLTGVRGESLWENVAALAADPRGAVYALDADTALIRQFDAEGFQVRRFGGRQREGGPFERPTAMAISPDGATLCVLDTRRVCVVRFNLAKPDDRPLIFGQPGKNNGQFKEPVAIALDGEGRTWVADAGSSQQRISIFDATGAFLFQFGRYDRGRDADELQRPALLAVDAAGATAYIYDSRRYEVMKFTIDQAAKKAAHATNTGGRGKEPGQYYAPVALACDRQGLLYVLDSSRRDVQAVDVRGASAVPLTLLTAKDLGLSSVEALALSADGLPLVWYGGTAVGLRWAK